MTSKEIRSKMLNGETIKEVCQEYQITFPELISKMSKLGNEKRYNSKSHYRTGHIYIAKSKSGRYIVRKEKTYYGSFKSLDDAKKVRDWFMCNGWNKRWINRACRICGVERCQH